MHTHTLLLVDDSITVQRLIQLTFADEPFRIVTAANGHLALERIESDRPDIVLASTDAPGLDGYAIARHVSQQRHLRNVPVLLLTDRFEPNDESRVSKSGANGILQKPLEPSVVIARVKRALLTAVQGTPSQASTSTSSSMPSGDRPDQGEKLNELNSAFDSIDAVMDEEGRPRESVTPDELTRIVSAAVTQAIADYERARGLSPDPALGATTGSVTRSAARDLASRVPPTPPAVPPSPWRTEFERLRSDLGIDEIEFEEARLRPAESVATAGLSAEMGIDDFVFDAPAPADEPLLPADPVVAAVELTASSVAASPAAPPLANSGASATTEPKTHDGPEALDEGLDWLAAELGSTYARRDRTVPAETTAPESPNEFEFGEDDLPPRASAVAPNSIEAPARAASAVFWGAPLTQTEADRPAAESIAGAEEVSVATRAVEAMGRGSAVVRTAWDDRPRIAIFRWGRAASARLVGRFRSVLDDRAQRRAQARAAAERVPEPPVPDAPAPPQLAPPPAPEPVASSTKTPKPQTDADTVFFTFDPIPPVPPRLPREPRKD